MHEMGNNGIIGLAFPATSEMSSAVGMTLLQTIFATLDDTRWFFAFNIGCTGVDSTLSIGEFDPALSNSTNDFVSSPIYIGPKPVPDYWKPPLLTITLNGTAVLKYFATSRVANSPTPSLCWTAARPSY
jgi:hypothetical protein